jgi:hypothetical protein
MTVDMRRVVGFLRGFCDFSDRILVAEVVVFRGEHRFEDDAELLARVASQGPTALARAARFREQKGIVIPLVCCAVVL